MTEREEALLIANRWLDGQMNPFVDAVPGDPDCAACILARQFVRLVSAQAPGCSAKAGDPAE